MSKLSDEAKGAVSLGIVASVYLQEAHKLNFGSAGMPGEGFTPVVIGLVLLACCLLVLAKELVGKFMRDHQVAAGSHMPQPAESGLCEQRSKTLLLIGNLIVYPFILTNFGFVISAVILLFVSLRIMRYRNWQWSLLAAILTTASAYILFIKWLNVYFPRGILG